MQPLGYQPSGFQPNGYQPVYDPAVLAFMPTPYIRIATDTCQTGKDCKRVADVERRGWDLTWLCARTWDAFTYYPTGIRIRPRPIDLGGESGFTGYEYEATTGGYSGESEPRWSGTTVTDGTVTWTRYAVSDASLFRRVASAGDVTWSADAPLTVSNQLLITTGGLIQITADHHGGSASRRSQSYALVDFDDGTRGEFVIRWKVLT
jgi:hypothetical protein